MDTKIETQYRHHRITLFQNTKFFFFILYSLQLIPPTHVFFFFVALSLFPSSANLFHNRVHRHCPTRCPMATGVPLYLSLTSYYSSNCRQISSPPPRCLTISMPLRSRRRQPSPTSTSPPPPHPSSPTNSQTTTIVLLPLESQPPYIIFLLGSHNNHHACFFGDIGLL